ncbi:MAG: glycoside hydrolase family 3 protein [Caldilineaceae bacterium]|nr:glycoside hydrolase family 3 protein [Caldilineaceae bacterium]
MTFTSRRHFLTATAKLVAVTLLSGCRPAATAHAQEKPFGELIPTDSFVDLSHVDLSNTPAVAPAIVPALPLPDPALEAKVGQMIMVGFSGQYPDFDSAIVQELAAGLVGNVVLFGRNIGTPEQVQTMTTTLRGVSPHPVLIGIDQEGGWVSRLPGSFGISSNYSAQYLGEQNDLGLTATQGNSTAAELAKLGINLNLAPVVDVNTNPRNPVIGRYERSFSADPAVVAAHAQAVIDAHRAHNVLCTLKHFPGHGSSQGDTHAGFVDVTEHWSVLELAPYATLIGAQACDVIMTAHIFNATLDPDYPSTLSRNVITGLLREQLGFNGVVISDDMQMGAIAKQYDLETAIGLAINAGVDMIAFSNNIPFSRGAGGEKLHGIIMKLVESGVIPHSRIEESYRRIMALKQRL